jgi:chemotaxis protein MotA
MFVIIGIIAVIGAVIGGYLMEHGNLKVLMQPAELLIIGGAAIGTLLIANPLSVVIRIFKGVLATFSGSRYSANLYLETLQMLNEIFQFARKSGVAKLEEEIEKGHESELFSKYPKVVKDHHAVHFLCDTLRTSLSGVVPPFELDQMMELDLEVHHHEAAIPAASLTTVADALPGLGIVAAVLGVVITMGALGGPPEAIGGCRRVGGYLPGNPPLLWVYRADRLRDEQIERVRRAVLQLVARGSVGIRQRNGAVDCGGVRAPVDPG